jgi:hypothetical protein
LTSMMSAPPAMASVASFMFWGLINNFTFSL